MHYRSFTIHRYRAISEPILIDIQKNSLLPIIGINESGKTTLLHAIFAFDHYNDDLNEGRHLQDTSNLLTTSSEPALVSAEVEVEQEELKYILEEIIKNDVFVTEARGYIRKRRQWPARVTVQRNIETQIYSIDHSMFPSSDLNHYMAHAMLGHLPYILYFDDFRDAIEETLPISRRRGAQTDQWLEMFERLFKATDEEYSLFSLHELEDRRRRTVLSQVNRHLNDTLTREWQNFRLDDTDALRIEISYNPPDPSDAGDRGSLGIVVVEKDADGNDHYFYVRDRSKGFYWFFNFVMKLEFNPKVAGGGERKAICLLDEPGSYLHASAQTRLCNKLRQISVYSTVIYCTHSHYLLDPDVIPLGSVAVASKSDSGCVELSSVFDYEGDFGENRAAYQPVMDALKIKPWIMDFSFKRVMIVEGITDYYAFEMFKEDSELGILPSVGADAISYYAAMLIALGIEFVALWDNDEGGRRGYNAASNVLGSEVAKRNLRLLPAKKKGRVSRKVQDLFDGQDVRGVRLSLELPPNSAFRKTVAALFYSSERDRVVSGMSGRTRENFAEVFGSLDFRGIGSR